MGGYACRQPFVVVRRLAADVIIGCTILDEHAESLQIRRNVIILADGTVVPIRRRAAAKPTVVRTRERVEMAPLPPKTNLVHVAQRIVLPPKPLNLENVEMINHEAVGPRQEKTKFIQRLKVLMKTADARLEKSQARYKRDFDKRVRQFNTGLKPGDLVFVKRETATESEERNRSARGAAIGHSKLRSKATGPYQVVAVTTSTVTII